MLPPAALKYVLAALQGTPDVLDGFLSTFSNDDPVWDLRPLPDRFTLREVVAHLADWEPIFHERIVRIRDEEMPFLKDIDEGVVAVTNDYVHSDAPANLHRFRQGRAHLIDTLRVLPPAAWQRMGNRELLGNITLENHVVLIAGHDGYHTHQVVQWLAAGGKLTLSASLYTR